VESVLYDTLSGIANDRWEEQKQFREPEDLPLQYFPRLTTPFFATPRANCFAGTDPAWVIPVLFRTDSEVLDEDQYEEYGNSDQESSGSGNPCSYRSPEQHLSFWLEKAGSSGDHATRIGLSDPQQCVRDRDATHPKPQIEKWLGLPGVGGPEAPYQWISPAGTVIEGGSRLGDLLTTYEQLAKLQIIVFVVPVSTSVKGEKDEPDHAIAPDYYWLRIVPKLGDYSKSAEERDAAQKSNSSMSTCDKLNENRAGDAFAYGNLPGILKITEVLNGPADKGGTNECRRKFFNWLSDKTECYHTKLPVPFIDKAADISTPATCGSNPFLHFTRYLLEVQTAADKYADCLDGEGEKLDVCPRPRARATAALRSLYGEDHSPAGVLLDAPNAENKPYSFVIAGDIQEGHDTPRFTRLLNYLANAQQNPDSDLAKTKFVLMNGDLADAEATSSPAIAAANVFGLWPPRSPYKTEFKQIADRVRGFPKPFVAVPGNHDAYVGTGGILNQWVSPCWLARLVGPHNPWVRWFGDANDVLPTLVNLRVPGLDRNCPPIYDGLAEWRYAFGLTSYAFSFRRERFVGLNSYNLRTEERSAVGFVVPNWGGGVRTKDWEWFDHALTEADRAPAENVASHTFVFMHQDPRASFPKLRHGPTTDRGALVNLDEPPVDQYGLYDEVETWASFLTLGHFGLGSSPSWNLYIPVLTPVTYQGSRWVGDVVSGRDFRQQEEWERVSFPGGRDTTEHYGADKIVGSINDHLWGAHGEARGVSHIFFSHDNLPIYEGPWVHGEREPGVVFPRLSGEEWTGKEFHDEFVFAVPYLKAAAKYVFKLRNDEPPDWAKAMWQIQGNADVYRLDDLADDDPGKRQVTDLIEGGGPKTNGFALVTVDPDKPANSQVTVELIDIPVDGRLVRTPSPSPTTTPTAAANH